MLQELLHTATLAQALSLVSWWKAFLILPPFIGWAWMVSSVFDKHTERFFLARETWGAVHMVAGLLGFAAALLIPIEAWWSFFIGYAAMLAILGADIGAFVVLTNRDDRVPEQHKLSLNLSAYADARAQAKERKLAGSVALGVRGPSGIELKAPQRDTPEYDLRVRAEGAYIHGLENRASRIDIAAGAKEAPSGISYVVDGVRQKGEGLSAQEALSIIDFWKGAAGLDVSDRRRHQAGMCEVVRAEIPQKVKVQTSGGSSGVRCTLIIDPVGQVNKKPEDLGLLDKQLELLQNMARADADRGVVLLAAPPQQGRTATMYAVARLHDAYTTNVQTIETDIQSEIEGVRQVEFNAVESESEFSTTVRSLIRRDPDVLSVAELPDAETAQEIARTDTSRTRVYASMKTDSALAALQMWVKAVGDPGAAAEPLRAVVAQKLVRTLCTNCKVGYQPPPDMLKKLGLPGDKVRQLFKKGGQVLIRNKPEVCPVCQGVGYVGQTGVFEVYPLGPEERKLIKQQNWSALRGELRKAGMPSIQQVALRKAVEGVTSVEEVTRVTAQAKPSGSSKSRKTT